MVQITNTLVAAAIIVPAIAAPVIESREPKVPFKTIAKVGGKVASGASLGLTVGGLLQGREEIEAREPKFTVSASRVGSIARGAGQAARTAKSGIEFGAAVAPLFPHKQRRDVGEQLETREPKFTSAQAKSFAKGAGAIAHTAKSGIEFGAAVAPLFPHKQRRSLDESDSLEVREPFRLPKGSVRTAGKALAGAAGFAGTVAALNTQQPREFDESELEAREPFRLPKGALRHAGHAAAGAAGFAGTVAALNTQQPRDFDDSELDARDPKFNFGKVLGKVASFVLRDDEMDGALYERDFDDSELDARDPKFNFGKALGKVASFVLRDDEIDGALYERDFDDSELDARDPKFNFGKVLGKVASFVLRDDEMDGSLYEREFDDAELLDAREPKFHVSGSTLRKAGHAAAGAAGFAGTVAALNTQQQRDFDDSELLDARDPKFNFGKVLGKVASFVIRDEETGELYVREFDDAELMDAREPEPFFIGSLIKGAAKVAKNFIRDDETGEIYYVREASNMDELD